MRSGPSIILASASPRRKEILRKAGLRFRVDESRCREEVVSGLKPVELAIHFSREKAREVALRHRNAIVIGADTLVVSRGRIFGKPRGKTEAAEMLRSLSGRVHSVITGYTVIHAATGKEVSGSAETRVFFKRLNPDEIASYVRSGEPMDKAGAYGIQGLGAVLVRKIEGDFFNVMGLPLNALVGTLKKFGIHVMGR